MKKKCYVVMVKNFEVEAETKAKAKKIVLSLLARSMEIIEVQPRTERCDSCDRTFRPSEIVKRDNEQLCFSCDADKYPLQDEDIPF